MSFLPNFVPSKPFTIGVEAEFQIIDTKSCNLTQTAPEILAQVPDSYRDKIKPEFIQSMLEVATSVCDTIEDVETDLRTTIQLFEKLADNSGCQIFAASLHPFADYREQHLTEGKRYALLMEELQIAGRRLITQGLHVHIGLPDQETLIKVCDGMRQYLPLLLALTSSSPYYGGEDTGFCSYRSRLLDALIRSGIPYTFKSWNKFNQLISDLHDAGLIADVRDIWWDVRPHPDFGTVEVRVCDLPVTFSEILAIAALIQALVKTLADAPSAHSFPRLEIIANNKWQAARHGLRGKFIDIDNISSSLTIKKAIENALIFCQKSSESLQTEKYLHDIRKILISGTGTDKLRAMHVQNMTFSESVQSLRKAFWT